MTQKYHPFLRLLHWLIALLILCLLLVGFYMAEFMPKDNPLRGTVYGLHKSFGVTVLILVFARIITRILSFVPPLPKTIHPVIRGLARVSHYSLYVVMVIMPLTGYAMSNSAGREVKLFGIALPKIFPDSERMAGIYREAHGLIAYIIIFLVTVHVLAAIKHRYFDLRQNNVLPRIWF